MEGPLKREGKAPLQFTNEIIHLTKDLRMRVIAWSWNEARCEREYVESTSGELEVGIENSDVSDADSIKLSYS